METARQVEQARVELEAARQEHAAARAEVERLAASGATDQALEQALVERDECALRIETREVRLAALEGRLAAEERASERARHVAEVEALIDRIVGWRGEFLQACQDCDEAMEELTAAFERRLCCARELMSCDPKGLREVERLLQPVWHCRAAAYAGLTPYLGLQHPWGDRSKWQGLAADGEAGVMREVDALLVKLRAEIESTEGEAA